MYFDKFKYYLYNYSMCVFKKKSFIEVCWRVNGQKYCFLDFLILVILTNILKLATCMIYFFHSCYHLIFIFMSFFFKNDLPNCKNLQIRQNVDLSLSANYVSDACSLLEKQWWVRPKLPPQEHVWWRKHEQSGLKETVFLRECTGWTPTWSEVPERLLEEMAVSVLSLSVTLWLPQKPAIL